MDDNFREQVFRTLNQKETNELVGIWEKNDHVEWSDTAFEVIKEILQNRLGDIPKQNEPIFEYSEEDIEEDQKVEQKDSEESIQALSPTSTRDTLSEKYPYLTAYIGFLALFVVFGIAAGLILIVPQFIYSSIVDTEMFSPFTSLFVTIFRIVVGFYAFRYVVKKHILPYSKQDDRAS